MHKALVVFSLVSVFSFDAFGGSLRSKEEIFSEPAKGGLAQVLLGFSELGLARATWPGLEREEQALAEAEKQLTLVRRTPTSEIEREARMSANADALVSANSWPVKVQVVPADPSQPTLADELRFLKDSDVVTAEEKARRVAAAEEVVAERMKIALKAAQDMGILERGLRILRKGTSVLIVTDALTRVYVWDALGANPGITPVLGYTAEQIGALLQ